MKTISMSEFMRFNPSELENETADNIPPLNHFQSLDRISHSFSLNGKPEKEREDDSQLPIHNKINQRLDGFISQNKIPHIIFHGPSGSGKLTLVKSFILRIYGGDKAKAKTHVMTVNCSHGKGIQFIREELKFFAKANTQSIVSSQSNEKTTGCDFKIILLLNAHHLTVDAQSALRRCIELFSYNTRFFIIVENKNKLLNPILSRFCDIFVPEPLDPLTNQPMNLHQYVLKMQFGGGGRKSAVDLDILSEIESHLANATCNKKDMMELVNKLYESGISCMDFMRWVGTRKDQWSELEHSRAIMLFHEIKPQFRCEKLLMLYMLNFLYSDGKI